MEHLLENFLTLSLEKNKTTHKLKKGIEPVYCSSTNLEGDLCQNDAYWRWGEDDDYCDRHLPLEGRMLFFLNDWEMTKDKEYDFETDSDESESESESDSSESESSSSEEEESLPSLDSNSDEEEFSDSINLGPDIEIKSEKSEVN